MSGKIWTREAVISAIQVEFASGRPLNYSNTEKRIPSLLRAAERVFGSWSKAVEAAGINYEDVCLYRTWSREKIIERIQEWYRKGADLSWRNVSQKLDPPLAAAALHANRFESWNDALLAAGIDPMQVRRYRKWSKTKVDEGLIEMAKQGVNLDQDTLLKKSPALLAAVYRYCDGLVDERKAIQEKQTIAINQEIEKSRAPVDKLQ